jgi:ABC-type glutathione transport system ATPase component
MPIISVRDLVVEYDGRRVLNGLNLDIERGETMVLLGGSGCGKSTLLRQIIGLERPKVWQHPRERNGHYPLLKVGLEEDASLDRSGLPKRGFVQFVERRR